MDRRQFLTLAGSALAAAVFLPVAPPTEPRQPPPSVSGDMRTAKVYCGSSVNANGRFRHYLVNGRRVTERVLV